jgi:hypothetical protein
MIERFARMRWVAVVGALFFAGCAGDGGGGSGGSTPRCKAPENPDINFATNIQPIFDRSCALSGCHDASRASGLDLSLGKSFNAIVTKRALGRPDRILVKPGAPDESYLIQKIENTPGISGQIMPQGCPGQPLAGAQCPTPDDLAALRMWVTECATTK